MKRILNHPASSTFGLSLLLVFLILAAIYIASGLFPSTGPMSTEQEASQIEQTVLDDGTQVVKYESLPDNLLNKPQVIEINGIEGKAYIVHARVNQIGEDFKAFMLSTDKNEDVLVTIGEDTMLADAWFAFDDQGNLVRIQFTPITLEELSRRVHIGDRVGIRYLENNFSLEEPFEVKEFYLVQ